MTDEETEVKLAGVAWTGGKDSNLALLRAQRHPVYKVICLIVFRPANANFRAHPIHVSRTQADAIGLPLIEVEVSNDPSYRESYVSGIRALKEEHGLGCIVTGDIDLVGTMQGNWIEECSTAAGVEVYLPLWQADRLAVLKELVDEKFHIVFSCVKSPWFDDGWISRRLSDETIGELIRKSESEFDGKRLDVCGENGEYHTTCLDGPLYKKRLELKQSRAVELEGCAGQKSGERWWVMESEICAHDKTTGWAERKVVK